MSEQRRQCKLLESDSVIIKVMKLNWFRRPYHQNFKIYGSDGREPYPQSIKND